MTTDNDGTYRSQGTKEWERIKAKYDLTELEQRYVLDIAPQVDDYMHDHVHESLGPNARCFEVTLALLEMLTSKIKFDQSARHN